MLTRTVRRQLLAFVVIAVVVVVYAAFRFTDLGRVLGNDGYTARLELATSGGIFSNAEVSYRGVNVGRVGELRLVEDGGIEVDLDIDPDAPRIPADLDAVVMNRSAVGEQFVDLRPRTDSEPYLSGESVIARDRTAVPLGADVVIGDLDRLAGSVPTDALRTVVAELYDAFDGTGEDLQALLDNTSSVVTDARAHVPQLTTLIDDGATVLRTQIDKSGNLTAFSRDLHLLAAQLKDSDPDLRRLIAATPGAANAVTSLLRESGQGLSVLTANLLTTSNIVATRLDGIEYTLVAYPLFSAVGQGVLNSPVNGGKAPLGLALNLFDPPPCLKGYESTDRRAGDDLGPPTTSPDDLYCAEPHGSPIGVRGSQNAPFNGVPKDNIPAPAGTPAAGAQGTLPFTLGQQGVGLTTLASLLGLSG